MEDKVRSIGNGSSYVRFHPNPGFSFKVWKGRWAHWCVACGATFLKTGESRKARRKKNGTVRKA